MDVTPLSRTSEAAGEPLGEALAIQRERIRGFVAAQRERLHRIEAELAARVQQAQCELARQEEEFVARRLALETAQHELHQRELDLERERGQHASERAQLESLRETVTRRSADLDARQEQLESLRTRTEQQRRTIVRQLRARRQAQSRESPRGSSAAAMPFAARPAFAPEPDGSKLSWEAQKRRLLAALESEDAAPEGRARHLEIEEVLRVTENALSEKDRELEEMRRVLDSQTQSFGEVAVGANALSSILEQDDLIREGRDNLQRLQQEWEEKLRQAEIDISLERAKLARERKEVEEKLRAYEEHHQPATSHGAGAEAKAPRGRWLARLGLKEEKPEA